MTIFDAQAIEAAAKAMNAEIQKQLIDGNGEAIDVTIAALLAAEASMMSRGLLTARVPSGADCHPDSPHASTFIIRKEAP